MNPQTPYNELPALPPPVALETNSVLKACIGARAALAELKTAADLIPNQTVLINVLPLLEARASTEVENIVTTNDELFRQAAIGDGRADPATKEALNYRTALMTGFRSLKERPLCTATAVEVCSVLKNIRMEIRRIPGTRLANHRTGEVIYTPPEGEDVLRAKLANWEQFLHEYTELDPLVRMAAGHYQFEAIHPFADGNGRTGRVMNLLFLVSEGLLREPVLYLSRYILRNRADYYEKLLAVTRTGDWEPWLLYMVRGVEETARWTSRKISAIRKLMDETVQRLRTAAPDIYSRELVEAIFGQAYCRISNLVDAGVAQRQTASTYLRRLAALGFVREAGEGRERLYINESFASLLFTEQAPEPESGRLREESSEYLPARSLTRVEKELQATDLPRPGKPHEITGLSDCRRVLGSSRRTGAIRWISLRENHEPQSSDGRFTWYDARARSAARTGRSEWRLYCEEGFPDASPGQILTILQNQSGEVLGIIADGDGKWMAAVRSLQSGTGAASTDSPEAAALRPLISS